MFWHAPSVFPGLFGADRHELYCADKFRVFVVDFSADCGYVIVNVDGRIAE